MEKKNILGNEFSHFLNILDPNFYQVECLSYLLEPIRDFAFNVISKYEEKEYERLCSFLEKVEINGEIVFYNPISEEKCSKLNIEYIENFKLAICENYILLKSGFLSKKITPEHSAILTFRIVHLFETIYHVTETVDHEKRIYSEMSPFFRKLKKYPDLQRDNPVEENKIEKSLEEKIIEFAINTFKENPREKWFHSDYINFAINKCARESGEFVLREELENKKVHFKKSDLNKIFADLIEEKGLNIRIRGKPKKK